MLGSIYQKAWDYQFKVSLSVVPFQKAMNDFLVPPQTRKKGEFYSIADNIELVEFLKRKVQEKSVEILQHGFSHGYSSPNRGELANASYQKYHIEIGRNILEGAFGTKPSFFVAPYEDISSENLEKIRRLGMIPIYRDTGFDKLLRSPIIPLYIKDSLFNRILYYYRRRYLTTYAPKFGLTLLKLCYIRVDDTGIRWHLPASYFAKIKSLENVVESTCHIIRLSNVLRRPICILNHYHTYFYDWNTSVSNFSFFRVWNKILELLQKLDFCWKVSFMELYDRARKIDETILTRTGSKITVKSKKAVEGFSIRVRRGIESNSNVVVDRETNIVTIEHLPASSNIVLYEK